MRRRGLRWVVGAALVAAAVAGLALATADGRYLARAGWEEIRILAKRRPIERLLADPATPEPLARQLALAVRARTFAAESLGLDVGDTYTTYVDVGRDTLLLVLSASERYRLAAHTWRYPVVGVVPYKGYFDPGAARREARRLEARGFDTYLRPAGAFSTLGWFGDPLLSTALNRDSIELVATVIHELAHNTLYIAGATPFNESFAAFVGYRGAERFFAASGDKGAARQAVAAWDREVAAERFFDRLGERLDSVYAAGGDTASLEAGRQAIFTWARETTGRGEWKVNNAVVIAARLYRTELKLFDEWLAAEQGDLAAAVAGIRARVAAGGDPYRALRTR